MCFPGALTITSILVSAGGAISQAQNARKERDRQIQFQKQQEAQERRNALASQAIKTEEIHAQQLADTESASIEIEQNRREAASQIGTARVVAGEVGAFGLSYEGLVNEFARQQAEFEGAIETNLALRNTFRRLSVDGTQNITDARMFNAQTLAPASPNYAGYALSGVGNFFQLHGGLKELGVSN